MIRVEVNQVQFVNRAIAAAGKDIQAEARTEIRAIGELVAGRAEALALGGIHNIGPVWWDMRVGQNAELVYVVPVQRGTQVPSRKRKNFAPLMLNRAMRPAAAASRKEIDTRFAALIAKVTKGFNSGR